MKNKELNNDIYIDFNIKLKFYFDEFFYSILTVDEMTKCKVKKHCYNIEFESIQDIRDRYSNAYGARFSPNQSLIFYYLDPDD